MFIYLIVNRKTGKYYVGQHKGNSLRKYLQQKLHHAQSGVSSRSHLYNSMRAHPDPSVWSIHTLRSNITDRAELNQTERDFIAFLKSQDPEYGYNLCRGGEGRTGPHTPEARQKIGYASCQLWSNPENRKKVSDAMHLVWKIPGYRDNFIAKMRSTRTGKKYGPLSESHKINMAAAQRKAWKKRKGISL